MKQRVAIDLRHSAVGQMFGGPDPHVGYARMQAATGVVPAATVTTTAMPATAVTATAVTVMHAAGAMARGATAGDHAKLSEHRLVEVRTVDRLVD